MESIKLSSIKEEIGNFYNSEFGEDLLFVIIYGSWAFGMNENCSDIDVVGVCSKHNSKQLENTISFIKTIHKKYNLALDEEVPYDRKVLVTGKFCENAINGKGFIKEDKIIIQPVVKNFEFLSSEKMAMRLFLNAITTKNIFCTGNYQVYSSIRHSALINCVRIFYSTWETNRLSVNDFVKNLISWRNKSGQEYLGFEDDIRVKSYLNDQFTKTFNFLEKEGYLTKDGGTYSIVNLRWFKEITQK